MSRVLRVLICGAFFTLGSASAQAVEPVSGNILDQIGEPPAPPSGFATPEEAITAVQTGKVAMIKSTPVPDTIEVANDIEYGRVGDRALKLDLYRPKETRGRVPGLIFIHGGGWSSGDKSVYKIYCQRFAEKGYVAASIGYRLSKEAPFPAAVQDAKCAVRWLRANAELYSVDPDKIAVLGGSAGGHLSMMVGYVSDDSELEGEGGHADTSSVVQAVVNFYGPTDLTVPFAHDKDVVINFLSKKKYADAPELYTRASPLSYLTKDDPPTLILHGTTDDIVPIDQADKLAGKLAELDIPYVYDRLEGWPHSMDIAQPVNDRCMWFIDRFLAIYLPLPN